MKLDPKTYVSRPRRGDPYAVSIDRKDNSQGYTQDNVVLCCFLANWMKLDFSIPDFKDLCRKIADWRNDDASTVAVRQLPADTESPCLGGSPAHD